MVRKPFSAAPLSILSRFHQRPSSNRGPSARTLKSPAHRPALERAARKTHRPHISIWRVPAVRRGMSPEASAATDSSGLPRAAAAWARSLRQTAVHRRREHALPGGATHSLAREGAVAARTYMWGRARRARRFRNASGVSGCAHGGAGEGGQRGYKEGACFRFLSVRFNRPQRRPRGATRRRPGRGSRARQPPVCPFAPPSAKRAPLRLTLA